MKIRGFNSIESLADKTYTFIEKSILTGRLKPGGRLVESKFSEMLSISRSPIREAFKRLEHEGLVKSIPRKGIYVIELSLEEVEQILDVREVIEGLAAKLCAEKLTDGEMSKIESHLNIVKKKFENDSKFGYPRDFPDFHSSIIEASKNNKLINIMKGLSSQSQLIRFRSGASAYRGEKALDEHFMILDAIKKRMPELAEQRMREHIRNAKDNIIKLMEKQFSKK